MQDPNEEPWAPWRPRFSIRTMLLLMLVCSIVGAGGSYLANYARGGARTFQLVFLLFVLAGPVVVMILVSGIIRLTDLASQRRRRP